MIVKFGNCLRKSIVLIIKVLEVDCVKNHKSLSFFEKPCQFTSPKNFYFFRLWTCMWYNKIVFLCRSHSTCLM